LFQFIVFKPFFCGPGKKNYIYTYIYIKKSMVKEGDWISIGDGDLPYEKVSYHTLSSRKIRENAIKYALKHGSARICFNRLESLVYMDFSEREKKQIGKDLEFANDLIKKAFQKCA
jgi:hypothetical protein